MLQYHGRKCLMIITSLTWSGKRRERQERSKRKMESFALLHRVLSHFSGLSLIQVSGFKEWSGTNAAVLSEAMSHKLWHLWFGLERRKRQGRRAREDTDFWADWLHLQSKLWSAKKGREQRCIALNPQLLGILFGVTWQQISPSDLQGRQIWVDYLNSHLGWHAKQPLGWWQASF